MVITPNCRSDTLYLISDWEEFSYYITKDNPERLTLTPFISQLVQTCYKECSLVQWGWDSYLNPPVVEFDTSSGELVIETNDYYFDGLELQLKLSCETPYSQQSSSETADIDYFEVKFTSECRDHIVTPAQPQFLSATTSLWSMLSIPFTPAQSANTDCGELHYSIVGASSPLVTIDSDNGKVNVYGR